MTLREQLIAEMRERLENTQKRIRDDINGAKQVTIALEENERAAYGPEPIAFDDEWKAGAAEFGRSNSDTWFWTLHMKVQRSQDCRDFGQFFGAIRSRLVR
jgi:hypothetical protein